jgi:hypothetical protein
MEVDRAVESNDGHRVVELRTFVRSRNVKVLCDVERVAIDLGAPGALLLGALDYLLPGTTEVVAAAQPLAEAVLAAGAREAARGGLTKAVAHVDSLSGKAVRIAYVDGRGVESLEPVGCTLSDQERDFLMTTAVLSDCYLLPDVTARPGATWAVDGAQLGGLVDPSLRGAASGELVLARDEDFAEAGKAYARLKIRGGTLAIDASDASNRRLASFNPRGELRYCLTDGHTDRATLLGHLSVEQVSTDHLLFETSFRTRPTLQVEYSCTIR